MTEETRIKESLELAYKALERIAEHERECGERWAEATVELRALKEATKEHSVRWEKVAWLVISAAGTTLFAVVTGVLL